MPHTIYELTPDTFRRAATLYANATFDQAAYDAVFEGKQPGRIFVDDPLAPRSALMCRSYEYYPAGEVHDGLLQFMREMPEETHAFDEYYRYAPVNEAWTQVLAAEPNILRMGRHNFVWPKDQPAPSVTIPDGVQVLRLDHALAERTDGAFPFPFMKMFWGSYERMLAESFGYCVLVGDEVATMFYPVAQSSKSVIVGIDTVDKFWRRGYGTMAAAAFFREALEKGLEIVWDCDVDNPRSVLMAQKLGFVEHTPFAEYFPPERPAQTGRPLWQHVETLSDGAKVWTQA